RIRHLPYQWPHGARRGADAVRRRQGQRLRSLRRQGGDQRVHRAALDYHPDRPAALSVLIIAPMPAKNPGLRRGFCIQPPLRYVLGEQPTSRRKLAEKWLGLANPQASAISVSG